MDMIGAEIFDVGNWNGLDFTDDDLNGIVDAFESLSAVHRVPLKLGHNEEQPVTDGQPALGWIKRIYREGTKLLADLSDMPRVIYEAIKSRRYRTVSVELLNQVKHKGSEYPWVLDAVALLGADQPAVNTLEDLDKLMATRLDGRRVVFSVSRGNLNETGESSMSETDIQGLNDRLDAMDTRLQETVTENAELKQENADLKSQVAQFTRDAEDREAEAKREAVKKAREGVAEVFERAVKAGSITPAQREHFERLFGVSDDEKVVGIDLAELAEAISAPESPVGKDDQGFTRDSDEPNWESDPEGFILGKANDFMADHNLQPHEFTRALDQVGRKYPKALKAYHMITGG